MQSVLIKVKWDVNQAVDFYYANDVQRQIVMEVAKRPGGGSWNKSKAEATFNSYKAKSGDVMDEDGIVNFYKAIGVDMETDIVSLMFSFHMQVKDKQMCMGEYTKAEFLKGAENLACDEISTWKAKVPDMRNDLNNEQKFKEMYKFVFGFACEKGFKSVEIESACALWPMLIGNRCKFLDKWIKFIEGKAEKKEITVMTRDTWDLFLDLTVQTKGQWSNFEDDGAWPVLIDQFNEYMSA